MFDILTVQFNGENDMTPILNNEDGKTKNKIVNIYYRIKCKHRRTTTRKYIFSIPFLVRGARAPNTKLASWGGERFRWSTSKMTRKDKLRMRNGGLDL